MAANDAETIREMEQDREKEKNDSLDALAEAIQLYQAEQARDGPGHMGRLSKQENKLNEAIDRAKEALNPGPITKEEIEEHREAVAMAERYFESK